MESLIYKVRFSFIMEVTMETFGELCLFVFIAVQLLDEHFYIYKLFTLELKQMYDAYENEEDTILEDANEQGNDMWPLPSEILNADVNTPTAVLDKTDTIIKEDSFSNVVIEKDTYRFISSLQESINSEEVATISEATNSEVIDLSHFLEEKANENKREEKEKVMDNTLTMQDWNEEIPKFELFKNHSHHIGDNIQGEQTWYCEIYGKNNGYIHILDLTEKMWVNVAHLNVSINLHHVVKLDVLREADQVTVKKLEYLDIEEEQENYNNFLEVTDDYHFEEHDISLRHTDY